MGRPVLPLKMFVLLLAVASSAAQTTTPSGPTTSRPACPLGWVDDGHLGCFLFAPQMAGLSWIEALEYCEEQDGFLAEPKTEEQLNFLTSLAYVEEMATGVQGW